jgi:RNA polymerase sigma-70 factor (ECF subfamily)
MFGFDKPGSIPLQSTPDGKPGATPVLGQASGASAGKGTAPNGTVSTDAPPRSSPSPDLSGDAGPGGPQTAAGAAQVVTTSIVLSPASARVDGPESLAATFRISRTPVSDTILEAPYTLTAYTGASCAGYDGTAVLSSGSDSFDVSLEPILSGQADHPEIVTLALRGEDGYQISQPSATMFLAGTADRCSEAALMEAYSRVQSSDAFRALVERHRPGVLQFSYRLLGNWADAEDVTQMVFLALAERRVRLRVALSGWLGVVARNIGIMLLRSKSRRSRHEQRAAKPDQVGSEESSHDLREVVEAALMQIPAPLREAVSLRYLEGLSQLEAAQTAGCPRGTLAQRAANGVRLLRGILGTEEKNHP